MTKLPKAYYETKHGVAYLADAKEILETGALDGTVDLVMTSPPFALRRKKEYGNLCRVCQ